jgi:hypothetical protein
MAYNFIAQDDASIQEDKTYLKFSASGVSTGTKTYSHDKVIEMKIGQASGWFNTADKGWDWDLYEKDQAIPTLEEQQEKTSAVLKKEVKRLKKRIAMIKATIISGYQPSPPPVQFRGATLGPSPGDGKLSVYGNTFIQSQKFEDKDKGFISAGFGVRSKMNAWALFKYLNQPGVVSPKDIINSGYNRTITSVFNTNPGAGAICAYAESVDSMSFNYSPSDFLQTEHFGKISNDYLVTLRRFAYPVPDDIINTRDFKTGSSEAVDMTQPDLARALTWMSPKLGNDMAEVLAFGMKYKWKDEESKMQELQGGTAANKRGALGSMLDGSSLGSAVESGIEGYGFDAAARKRSRGDGYDAMSATYPNHVYGPLNVIKRVVVREQGLEFDQSFTLKFYYDLKGSANTSPRVQFMDTMANLLALTYNNAPFWGGGARWTGGSGASSTGKPFGDYEKLKNGDYAGFAQSLVKGISSKMKAGVGDLKAGVQGILSKGLNGIGDSKILDNVIGGGLMKMLGGGGATGGQTAAAFLTGDPTGQWHLTIGNPATPIMVCGNLALESSKIKFGGPLGFEGFPSSLILECALKPARPRDKAEIESMFNAGRGRFYLTPDTAGARDLDDVVDVSQYGNKDKKLKGGMADRISDMSSG